VAWKKGESGNPHGRPAHPLAERFRGVVEPRLDEIITAMVDAAANGDAQAAKLLMDRVLPTFKPVAQATAFKLDGDSLTAKAQAILAAVAAGLIAISDAKQLIDALALEERTDARRPRWSKKALRRDRTGHAARGAFAGPPGNPSPRERPRGRDRAEER